MLGLLASLAFASLCLGFGWALLAPWTSKLDPAERVGVSGLIGLSVIGLLTLLVGLLPKGLVWGLALIVPLLIGASIWAHRSGLKGDLRFQPPRGVELVGFCAFVLIAGIALIGVLSPSTSLDWDSLAYHLAVPKIWLLDGQIGFVPGVHHSNFPFAADCLYIWGLMWGGEAGAKAINWTTFVFGGLVVFGLVRRWSGSGAAYWALLAFGSVPVVAWEAGTAYVDLVHGLYATLAMCYAAEYLDDSENGKAWSILAGLSLGGCLASKLTGLQVTLALGAVMMLLLVLKKQRSKHWLGVGLIIGLGLLVATPWFLKSVLYTGNPVYPFFYKMFGGREWSEWQAAIYQDEQKSFGLATSLTNIGHSLFGLAYQPGRYFNPAPTEGAGFPTGAVGFAAVLFGVLATLSGRVRQREVVILGSCGVLLAMWFVLSQQSRYLTIVAIPLLVAAFSLWNRWQFSRVAQAIVLVQAGVTIFVLQQLQVGPQLQLMSGKVSLAEHYRRGAPFALMAEKINVLPDVKKVALYDEVFGFFLIKSYMWANPGHTNRIPYSAMTSGVELATELTRQGFSHVVVNVQYLVPDDREKWLGQMGLRPGSALTPSEISVETDLNVRWRLLVADAVVRGRFQMIDQNGPHLLFKMAP